MTLAAKEKKLAASLGPSERAKRLYPKLMEEAVELRRDAKRALNSELLEFRAELMEQAADIIRVLETEQFRQRTAAATHLDGMMDRAELRSIVKTWNQS